MQEIALSVAAAFLLFGTDEDREQIGGLETLSGKAWIAW